MFLNEVLLYHKDKYNNFNIPQKYVMAILNNNYFLLKVLVGGILFNKLKTLSKTSNSPIFVVYFVLLFSVSDANGALIKIVTYLFHKD